MSIESVFLSFAAEKLEEQMSRIESCVAKLTPEQIWARGGENQNAIGNLLLHLQGNVRQWIVTSIGGEPDTRARSAEFAARDGEALSALQRTIGQATAVIRELPASRLLEKMTIQGYEVTALEAIFHVVEHFSGHTAQIIFATKSLTKEDLGFYAHLSE